VAIETIPGATTSDLATLKGTELADTFTIEGKNQYINGLAGADTVTAASGLDNFTIDTGADNDTVTLSGEAASVLINLHGGNDKVTLVDTLNSSINGGDGSDTITQGANRTFEGGQIFGRSGNDDFSFVNIKNVYIGGDQDDDSIVSTGTATSATIRGGNQRDTITLAAVSGSSLVKGDKHEDNITVTGTVSGLYVGGDADNDTITISSATASTTTIRGGSGADDINISSAAILSKGDSGNDDIDQTTTNANHTIYGGAGGDSIDASSTRALLIYGDQETEDATNDGNDVITLTGIATSAGAHSIYGGAGKDTITTATGDSNEYIDAGAGADNISSSGGQDSIFGRAGADTINITFDQVAGTARTVQAGADDDVITFDNAAFAKLNIDDTIKGELGTDTIALIGALADYNMTTVGSVDATSLDNVTAETFAYGSTSTNEATLAGTITHTFSAQAQTSGFRSFDATHTTTTVTDTHRVLNISAAKYTSVAGVTMSGSADKDVIVKLVGGSGADVLNDGAASDGAVDTLTGGAGIDTFNVTATTADTVITDLGVGGVNDIFTVSSAANGADITVSGDYVATSATINNKSLAGVTLSVASGVDVNMGAATGNFGFDIDGGTAASTLSGSAKADSIDGNAGADSLVGNAGNDTIAPAAGSDTVSAGEGDDSIVFTGANLTAADSIDGGAGTDVITVPAGSTSTVDFDRISNLTAFTTTNDAGDTTVAITDIAETDTQVITLTSIGDATTKGLVTTNVADSSTTTFSMVGSAGDDVFLGSNGADTLSGGTGGDTLTGGAGVDDISSGAGTDDVYGGDAADSITLAAGAEQVFYTATTASLMATEAGSTAGTDVDFVAGTSGDKINTFATGADKLDFKDALLTNAKGTETDTLASITAGGVVASTNVFVEVTTAVADGTMGTAITQLSGLITDAIEIGDSFVAFQNDGVNGYLYLVDQVSDADTIAAQDVTLIGQLAGVTDVANGDFTTLA
jgi:Ca2+-binding RTX toxin-like protein